MCEITGVGDTRKSDNNTWEHMLMAAKGVGKTLI
jgi:hypothetical protein